MTEYSKHWKINPFLAINSAQDRLDSWKELRKSLIDLTDYESLQRVAEYWSYVPVSNFSYNPEVPENWPTPWELVSKGNFCKYMVAVAMECTLRLAGWSSDRIKIIHLRDYDISEEMMILKIDEKYALNYTMGEVVEYPKTEQIITNIIVFSGKQYTSTIA